MSVKLNNRCISVLMVLDNTGRAGAQTFAMNVFRSLNRDKFTMDFAVTSIREHGYQDEIRSSGGNIILIPKFKGYNYFNYKNQWDVLTKKYDIIHGNVTSPAVIYLKIAKKNGCKTILHSHSDGYRGNRVIRFIKKIFTRNAKKYADLWFACSDKAAVRVFGENYRSKNNYFDIPNAINPYRYQFNESYRKKIREKYCISTDVFLVGHVGSFTLPKNHFFLLKVFKEILLLKPNSKLVLLGYGPLESEIRRVADEYNILNRIIFAGSVENVNEYLMAMDVMVFPSLFEGFGIALLEAQATGLHVVYTDTLPSEVKVSDCAECESLSASEKEWAEKAIKRRNQKRERYYKCIENTRYDIYRSINEIQKLYES